MVANSYFCHTDSALLTDMGKYIYAVAIVEKDNPRFPLADSFINTRAAGAKSISGHVTILRM